MLGYVTGRMGNGYLQLSISMWQSWRSIGKYCKFIGHDAVIVKLEGYTEGQQISQWRNVIWVSTHRILLVIEPE